MIEEQLQNNNHTYDQYIHVLFSNQNTHKSPEKKKEKKITYH